jgi:hypothetical protein
MTRHRKVGLANVKACRDPSFSIPLPATPNLNAKQVIVLPTYRAQGLFNREVIHRPVSSFSRKLSTWISHTATPAPHHASNSAMMFG